MRHIAELLGWVACGGVLLVGCTATKGVGAGGVPARWGEASAAAPAAPASAAPTPAPAAASGEDRPVTPAPPDAGLAPLVVELLASAQELAGREQYEAALALLEPLAERGAAPTVAAARVGLLRDLGRRSEALAALRELVADVGPAALHPGLLFEWAELAWLEARPAEASSALRAIAQHHVADPWRVAHADELAGLQRELARGAAPQRLRVRDLLAELRGQTDPQRRLWSLERLLAVAGDGEEPLAVELRSRAAAIAAGDPEPAIRALALRAAEVHPDEVQELCAAGGDDPAPLVRLAAVQRSRRLADRQALPLLWTWLHREGDGAVFASIHMDLAARIGDAPVLPDDASDSAAARAAVRQQWQERFPAGPAAR